MDHSSDSNEVYMIVDTPPDCGDLQEVMKYINYPVSARKAGIEGRVLIQAVVDKSGTIIDPKVVRSVHKSLDSEALSAIKQLKCRPGKQNNVIVPVQLTFPLYFRLQ